MDLCLPLAIGVWEPLTLTPIGVLPETAGPTGQNQPRKAGQGKDRRNLSLQCCWAYELLKPGAILTALLDLWDYKVPNG